MGIPARRVRGSPSIFLVRIDGRSQSLVQARKFGDNLKLGCAEGLKESGGVLSNSSSSRIKFQMGEMGEISFIQAAADQLW